MGSTRISKVFSGPLQVFTDVVAVSFGALTREDAGAVPVSGSSIVGGDPSGHFKIVNGSLVPTAIGDAADLNQGPYSLELNDGSTYLVSIVPNEYSAYTLDEVDTAGNLTAGGYTIRLRNRLMTNPVGLRLFRSKTYTTPITVTAEDGGGVVGGCSFEQVTNCTFTGLTFEAIEGTVRLFTARGLNSGVNIVSNTFRGNYRDPLGDYSGGYTNAECFRCVSGLGGNGLGGSFSQNLVEHVAAGPSITVGSSEATTIELNEIRYSYEDSMQVSIGNLGHSAVKTIQKNVLYFPVALGGDAGNPHTDMIQFLGGGAATDRITNFTVENNVGFVNQNISRGSFQGLTSFDHPSIFDAPQINGNFISTPRHFHNIRVHRIDGGSISDNTAVMFDDTVDQANTARISASAATGDDPTAVGPIMHNNISGGLSGFTTDTGSVTATPATNYASVFEGPDFSAPTDYADFISKFTSKIAAGATNAYNFGTPRVDEGWGPK